MNKIQEQLASVTQQSNRLIKQALEPIQSLRTDELFKDVLEPLKSLNADNLFGGASLKKLNVNIEPINLELGNTIIHF